MKTIIQPELVTSRPSMIATRFGVMFALAIAGVVLAGSNVPAAAGKADKQGGQHNATPAGLIPKPVVRDHRAKPVVRDARAGTVTRDHRGGSTVTVSGGRPRQVPCYGNLC
jgi:hypothetical protein